MCPRSRQRRPSSAVAAADGIHAAAAEVLDAGLDVETTGAAEGVAAIAAVLAAERHRAELYFDILLTLRPAFEI